MTSSQTKPFQHLLPILTQARSNHRIVVLATGVFDLLHQEHRLFLQKASQLGGILLVGVESDERVRRLKGQGRPVQPQAERVVAIERLGLAAAVFVLPDQFDQPADHEALIEALRPDVLAVSEHTAHQSEKAAIMAKFGGVVIVVHRHNQQISTTQLLKQQLVPETKEKL